MGQKRIQILRLPLLHQVTDMIERHLQLLLARDRCDPVEQFQQRSQLTPLQLEHRNKAPLPQYLQGDNLPEPAHRHPDIQRIQGLAKNQPFAQCRKIMDGKARLHQYRRTDRPRQVALDPGPAPDLEDTGRIFGSIPFLRIGDQNKLRIVERGTEGLLAAPVAGVLRHLDVQPPPLPSMSSISRKGMIPSVL